MLVDELKNNSAQTSKNAFFSAWRSIQALAVILLGVSYFMELPLPVRFLSGGLFLGVLLLSKEEESFYLLMFILCGNELLNFGTTSITMIFVALFTVKYLILKGLHESIRPATLFVFCLLSLFCIAVYCFKSTSEQFVNAAKQMFFLCYIYAVLDETKSHWKRLYGNAFRFVAGGITFFGFLSILHNGIPSLTERYKFSEEITINFVGIVCALSIVNLLYDQIVLKSRYATLNVFLIFGSALFGILTQSRSFVLAVIIGVVLLFLLSSSLRVKLKSIFYVALAAILGGVIVVCSPLVAQRMGAVFNRIINPSNEDISNGRYELWEATIERMLRNPDYTWLGAGDYNTIAAAFDNEILVAHNMFLETWVIFGFIGCLLIGVLFWQFIKWNVLKKQSFKFSFVSLVPIAVMLCALFYSHHFIGRSMCMVFIMSFLPIVVTKNIRKEGEQGA